MSAIKIKILKSTIKGFIDGGNRMQAFSTDFNVEGYAKDPDNREEYNVDAKLTKNWDCQNMNTKSECTLIDNSSISLNQSDFSQFFKAHSLAPYNSYEFIYIINDTSTNITYNFTAVIMVVEMDIPVLGANFDPSLLTRPVNINEDLTFNLILAPG